VVKAGPLSWTVTFAEPVNGVTTSNFGFVTGAVTGTPTFTSVTPSGSAPSATWTVATSETSVTGTNSGSIGLNLTSVGSIADVATNALSGTPVTGEAYAYDTTGPSLVSATSGGGTAGKMETGDTLSLTFDEALAPASVPSSVTVTEARATGNTTLTIPGLIQSSVISNGYLGGNNSSGTASSMSIVLSNGNKTVTITLGTVTLAGSGVATGTGTVTLSPGAALTDNAANGAITASTAALPKLF